MFRLKVAPSSYRFFHFGLPFPPPCAIKVSHNPKTVVKRVHHIHHVLVRLLCHLMVVQSLYRFLHFGLPFPPLCVVKESDSPKTIVKRVHHIPHILVCTVSSTLGFRFLLFVR